LTHAKPKQRAPLWSLSTPIIKSFTLLLFALTTIYAHGQWIGVPFPGLQTGCSCQNGEWIDSLHFYTQDGSGGYCYFSGDAGETIDTIRVPVFLPGYLQFISSEQSFQLDVNANKLYRTVDKWNHYDTLQISENGKSGFQKGKMRAFFFWKNGRGIVIGDSNNGCSEVWSTSYFGKTWSQITCSNSSLESINWSFSFGGYSYNQSGNLCFINGGSFFRTDDFGMSWQSYPQPKGMRLFGTPAFKDSLRGLCRRTVWYLNETSLARTFDGGKTWDTSLSIQESLGAFKYVKKSEHYPGMYIAIGNGSLYSYDDGVTWNRLDTLKKTGHSFWNAEIGIFFIKNDGNGIGGYLFDPSFFCQILITFYHLLKLKLNSTPIPAETT